MTAPVYIHPFIFLPPSLPPSICPSVRQSVRPSVRPSHLFDLVFGLLQFVWFVGELQFGFSFSFLLQEQLTVLPLLPRLHTVVKHTLRTNIHTQLLNKHKPLQGLLIVQTIVKHHRRPWGPWLKNIKTEFYSTLVLSTLSHPVSFLPGCRCFVSRSSDGRLDQQFRGTQS